MFLWIFLKKGLKRGGGGGGGGYSAQTLYEKRQKTGRKERLLKSDSIKRERERDVSNVNSSSLQNIGSGRLMKRLCKEIKGDCGTWGGGAFSIGSHTQGRRSVGFWRRVEKAVGLRPSQHQYTYIQKQSKANQRKRLILPTSKIPREKKLTATFYPTATTTSLATHSPFPPRALPQPPPFSSTSPQKNPSP